MRSLMLARNAMATRFELVLYGCDEHNLKAAGEEALNEIERIESRISPFKPDSEISLINQKAYFSPIRASIEVYQLLKTAKQIWQNSDGAFDITIGELMKLWGFRENSNIQSSPEAIEKIRKNCGMRLVQLDNSTQSVKFLSREVKIDLGAIGKGYAIDQAIDILQESGVKSALLHGGTSTTSAIGTPPDLDGWNIAIEIPPETFLDFKGRIATIKLSDNSLSISGIWGRVNRFGDKTVGHIIDPRNGMPANKIMLAAAVCKSATYSDALSTALLVAGEEIGGKLAKIYPDLKYLFVKANYETNEKPEIHFYGIEPACGCDKFFNLKQCASTE
ncbi:MAG: FAD:protein FMN transferase [Verrucomicrobiia bacterium]|jgi:thiamine biosynthesis lipoprotein